MQRLRVRGRAIAFASVLLAGWCVAPAQGAIAVGAACSKPGALSGAFVCTASNGRVAWKALKRQTITAATPASLPLLGGSLSVLPVASSLLPVRATSRTPAICLVNGARLQLISAGACLVEFVQPGNSVFAPARLTKRIAVVGDNRFSVPTLSTAQLSARSVTLPISASSGLAVTGSSQTPSVCTAVGSGTVQLLTAGQCSIVWEQRGDEFHPAAPSITTTFSVIADNAIAFTPPTQLAVTAQPYTLSATATSGQPVVFTTTGTGVCTISGSSLRLLGAGTCIITAQQDATGFYAAATPITRTITVVVGRVTFDQPDTATGYQLHFVYVVPSDGVDHSYDTDGTIKSWIDEGQDFMQAQLGVKFPVDSTATGYDIQYLKSSFTAARLSRLALSCMGGDGDISSELGVPCLYRGADLTAIKHYVYLIDVTDIAGQYCGYAARPGNVAVVAIAPRNSGWSCTGASSGFTTWRVSTWVHEVLHGLGVAHVPSGNCDIMESGGGNCRQFNLDAKRQFYVGTAAYGIDILTLGFWRRQ